MRGVDDAAWAPRGDRTCIVILSLVAIGSSNEAFVLVSGDGAPALKVKRTKLKKVTKESGALNQKHRGEKSCDEE
jgi:hypothetical protein